MAAKPPAMSPSDQPVEELLERATGRLRAEAEELLALLGEVSGEPPVVWAGRIIGFGEYEYRYDSGHGGHAPLLAFAPGPAKHTVYFANDFSERWPDLMQRLGKHRSSKACLYLTRLAAVDRDVLRELLERSLAETRSGRPEPATQRTPELAQPTETRNPFRITSPQIFSTADYGPSVKTDTAGMLSTTCLNSGACSKTGYSSRSTPGSIPEW